MLLRAALTGNEACHEFAEALKQFQNTNSSLFQPILSLEVSDFANNNWFTLYQGNIWILPPKLHLQFKDVKISIHVT
jgi:hypothetical protein